MERGTAELAEASRYQSRGFLGFLSNLTRGSSSGSSSLSSSSSSSFTSGSVPRSESAFVPDSSSSSASAGLSASLSSLEEAARQVTGLCKGNQWELADRLCSLIGLSRSGCIDHLIFIGGKSLGEATYLALLAIWATSLAVAFLELTRKLLAEHSSLNIQRANPGLVDGLIQKASDWLAKENQRLGSLSFRFGLSAGWTGYAQQYLLENSSLPAFVHANNSMNQF